MPNTAEATPSSGQFGPDVYAAWRHSSLGEITETLELRLILRLAGPLQGKSVLDVGCGDGTLALVAARHDAARVVGCDPDPRMIARARAQEFRQQYPDRFHCRPVPGITVSGQRFRYCDMCGGPCFRV